MKKPHGPQHQQHEEGTQGPASWLPAVPLTREQVVLTGGTLLTTGAIDLATHLNGTTIFVGALATFVVARHSHDIVTYVQEHCLPPGHDVERVADTTRRVAARLLPAPQRRMSRQPHPARTRPRHEGEEQASQSAPTPARTNKPVQRRTDRQASGKQAAHEDATRPVFAARPATHTLRLGTVAGTRRRFDPPMNRVLGSGMLLAGSPGMGKSNLIGLLATSAGTCEVPFVLIDFKREFYTLDTVVKNLFRAGHGSYAREARAEGRISPYYLLGEEDGEEFARMVLDYGFPAIIDIPSYGGDGEAIARVLTAAFEGLFAWSAAQPEEGRIPCLVITDEAHHYLPSARKLSAFPMEDEAFRGLQSAYSKLLFTGRSYGYTLVMATQRLPNMATWAISTLQVKVLLGMVEHNDLKRAEEETGGLITREAIKALALQEARGTGIVVGLTREPMTVRFDRQPARHVSTTPSVERVQERRARAPRPHLSRVLARRVEPLAPSAPAVPPETEPLPTEMEPLAPNPLRPRLSAELEAAYEAYRDGMSKQRLAQALGIGATTAYSRIQSLKGLGLIDPRGIKQPLSRSDQSDRGPVRPLSPRENEREQERQSDQSDRSDWSDQRRRGR